MMTQIPVDYDRRQRIQDLLDQARELVQGINVRMEEIQGFLEDGDDDERK